MMLASILYAGMLCSDADVSRGSQWTRGTARWTEWSTVHTGIKRTALVEILPGVRGKAPFWWVSTRPAFSEGDDLPSYMNWRVGRVIVTVDGRSMLFNMGRVVTLPTVKDSCATAILRRRPHKGWDELVLDLGDGGSGYRLRFQLSGTSLDRLSLDSPDSKLDTGGRSYKPLKRPIAGRQLDKAALIALGWRNRQG